MKEGVGIEMFAKYCADKANEFVSNLTNNRCWVKKVEVWEHEQNSAIYTPLQLSSTTISWTGGQYVAQPIITPFTNASIELDESILGQNVITAVTPPPLTTMTSSETEANLAAKSVVNSFLQPNSPPLYGTKSTGYSDPFKGTSWGNSAGVKR